MNKPLLSALIFNGILLSGCQGLPVEQMAALAGAPGVGGTTASTMQEVWVDRNGYQADFQDTSDCGLKSKVATQQVMKTEAPAKGLLDTLKGAVMENMEQSKQQADCMLSKGYVKTKVTADKLPPQKPGVNTFNNGYGQQVPNNNYNGYPPQNSYAPNGYQAPNGYNNPAPNNYVPNNSYNQAPGNYAPNSYVPQAAPNSYSNGYNPNQAPANIPNNYAPNPYNQVPNNYNNNSQYPNQYPNNMNGQYPAGNNNQYPNQR